MPKIQRKLLKMFGSTPGPQQMGQFGSLANNAPVYTNDIEQIQALSNYLTGWYSAVVGGASPPIQDMNSLCYLYAYQLCYLMQAGVPEWNSETTYYIGSIVNNGGTLYVSLTDDNVGNALTSKTNWRPASHLPPATVGVGQSPVAVVTFPGLTYLVNTAGAVVLNLPATVDISSGYTVQVKDSVGLAAVNPISIVPNGAQQIEGLAGAFNANAPFGSWVLMFNGTNWSLVG